MKLRARRNSNEVVTLSPWKRRRSWPYGVLALILSVVFYLCYFGQPTFVAQGLTNDEASLKSAQASISREGEIAAVKAVVEATRVREGAESLFAELEMAPARALDPHAFWKTEIERARVHDEIRQLEAKLARNLAQLARNRSARSVTVDQVRATLSEDTVLVDWVFYRPMNVQEDWKDHYGATVWHRTQPMQWISLPVGAEVNKLIAEFQALLRSNGGPDRLEPILRSIYDQLWEPVQKLFPPGTRRVIIAPEHELHRLSFATLLSAKREFVGGRFLVQYVASARDLVRDVKRTRSATLVAFGDPNFGDSASTRMEFASTRSMSPPEALRRSLQNERLTPLPRTREECTQLQQTAERDGWQSTVLLSTNATEVALQSLESPAILHLATHGYAVTNLTVGSGVFKAELRNPMHRSGLLLAGAQATFDAWRRGEIPPTDNDGVLTAEEVAGLHLAGTWLVTLSACETGIGEIDDRDGVLGLRRALTMAGVQNQLLTLWPVSDRITSEFMGEFYKLALKSKDAGPALANTQRDWLGKLKKNKGITEAARLAGPFILISQGRPE